MKKVRVFILLFPLFSFVISSYGGNTRFSFIRNAGKVAYRNASLCCEKVALVNAVQGTCKISVKLKKRKQRGLKPVVGFVCCKRVELIELWTQHSEECLFEKIVTSTVNSAEGRAPPSL